MASWFVLQYFLILLAIKGFNASAFHQKSLGVLSQLFSENSKNPLIVVVDSANELRAFEDDEGENKAADAKDFINEAIVKENYEDVLFNVLKSQAPFEGNEEEQEAHRELIANALRERCQAKIECERKCSRNTPKKDCEKSCKAVYDYLVQCPPASELRNKPHGGRCGKSCRHGTKDSTRLGRRRAFFDE